MIDPVDWQIRKAEAESYLSEIASRLQDAGLRVSIQLYDGRPAEQIIEAAHAWDADLILMSSHGQSGISPWNVSSVVQQVILPRPPFRDDRPGLSAGDRRSDRAVLPQDLSSVGWFPESGNAADVSRISGTRPQQ